MMRANPAVDVVLLSWNRLDYTLRAISSVQQQLGVAASIWIVDQASDTECVDALRDVAGRDPRISVHLNASNLGVAAGRNLGMSQGSADYIFCLDNDAVFESDDALAHTVERFQRDPTLAAIGFRILDRRSGQDDRVTWGYPRPLLDRSDSEFFVTRYVGAGHAILRSALNKTEGYDEELFFYWEELDLSYQFIEAGYRILYDPAVVISHESAPEMRAHWHQRRYYFYVRNALYLDYKYFGDVGRAIMQATGYLIKGLYNGLARYGLEGIMGAAKMIQKLPKHRRRKLSERTMKYLWANDLRHRGHLWRRFRDEILERLPGS